MDTITIIIVAVMTALFFGGILLLEIYSRRKGAEKESRSGQPASFGEQ